MNQHIVSIHGEKNHFNVNFVCNKSLFLLKWLKIINKRNNFKLNVVQYLFLESNVPDNKLYNVFYFQALRYPEICSSAEHFFLVTLKYFLIDVEIKVQTYYVIFQDKNLIQKKM